MISYRELRTLSLDFRRISSNLLNSDDDNADVNMIRFKKFIDETPFISQLLHNAMDGVDYDFKKCFLIEDSGWHSIEIPADDVEDHIIWRQFDNRQWRLSRNAK